MAALLSKRYRNIPPKVRQKMTDKAIRQSKIEKHFDRQEKKHFQDKSCK